MDVMASLIAVVLLLAANAFFVAAEFALVKARGFRISALADQGSSAARLTEQIQDNLEAYLAACQLGITMASLGLGWVGEPAVATLLEPLFHAVGVPQALLHSSAFLVGFLIFSSLHIVVGEQVPKTIAIRRPEPVSLWVAYPLHVAYLSVWPLNWLLNRASRTVLRLFGVEEADHGEVLSDEELKGLAATSCKHGEIRQDKAEMLNNLFELDQRQVGRVMIRAGQVHRLDLAAAPEGNLATIRETEHSRFLVIDGADNDQVVGILLSRDIFNALLAGEPEPWRDLRPFCREPLIVPETQGVRDLFEQMRARRAHLAVVVDEDGELAGIITLEDLLEEIVGEIHDETDEGAEVPSVVSVGTDRWEADGLVSLGDVERHLGLQIPAELEANTLSGLFMEQLARMPVLGDEILLAGFHLRVLSLSSHRVGRVSMERASAEQHATDDLNRDHVSDETELERDSA